MWGLAGRGGWKISGIESLRLEARRFGSIRDPSGPSRTGNFARDDEFFQMKIIESTDAAQACPRERTSEIRACADDGGVASGAPGVDSGGA